MNVERDRDWALASLVRAVVNDSGSESAGMRIAARDDEVVMNKSFARFLLTIIGAERAAEREACARIASGMDNGMDCDDRGTMDPETGGVPCSAETRGDVCVCSERSDVAFRIADRIRARKQKE